jgi:apolipoprotein D and lipocalin family protein
MPRPLVAVMGLLIAGLAGCAGRPEGIDPIAGFDPARYQGTWYEVWRLENGFERGLNNVTAEYRMREDGKIDVVNRGLDRADCEWEEATGTARFQGNPDVASLSVTFFWPFSGGYHVLDLDRQDYSWAAVAGPSREYLWLLSRQPDLPPDVQARLFERARSLGFPVNDLIHVDQRPPECRARPQ